MSSRPESLESSGRSLTGFIVLFLVMNRVSPYSWEPHQRSPNASPALNWRNITLESFRQPKEYRSVCHAHSDCRNNAYICRGGLCDCAFGFKLDEKTEMCVGAIGAKCMYDSHCISRAYCKGQTICTCKLEYPVVSSDNWSCVENGSKAPSSESSSLLSCVAVGYFFHIARVGGVLSSRLV